MSNDFLGVDNERRRNRQGPTVVPIMLGNVQAELLIDSDKFIGHLVFKTVARGDFIPRIAEDIHGEVLLVGY